MVYNLPVWQETSLECDSDQAQQIDFYLVIRDLLIDVEQWSIMYSQTTSFSLPLELGTECISTQWIALWL